MQLEVGQYSPNVVKLNSAGVSLLENLTPESNGSESVKKQMEDFQQCWQKLDDDVKESIEKVSESSWFAFRLNIVEATTLKTEFKFSALPYAMKFD